MTPGTLFAALDADGKVTATGKNPHDHPSRFSLPMERLILMSDEAETAWRANLETRLAYRYIDHLKTYMIAIPLTA